MEGLRRSSIITFRQASLLFKEYILAHKTFARQYVTYSIMKSCIENLHDVCWTSELWQKSFSILQSLCWKTNWVFGKLKIVIGFPCWGNENKIRKNKMQFDCYYCVPLKYWKWAAINLYQESTCINYAA